MNKGFLLHAGHLTLSLGKIHERCYVCRFVLERAQKWLSLPRALVWYPMTVRTVISI